MLLKYKIINKYINKRLKVWKIIYIKWSADWYRLKYLIKNFSGYKIYLQIYIEIYEIISYVFLFLYNFSFYMQGKNNKKKNNNN